MKKAKFFEVFLLVLLTGAFIIYSVDAFNKNNISLQILIAMLVVIGVFFIKFLKGDYS